MIVVDMGDCLLASIDLSLGQDTFINNAFFASVGFGIPAALGAQIANPKKRVIGIIGDGAFQMTATELSTAVRYHLDPIILLLNNHGYGMERPILEGNFNDLVNWNYAELPKVLGDGVGLKVTNETELEQALDIALKTRGTFYIIEVELKKEDFSPALRRLGELIQNRMHSKKI
jgi:indolepyruvate decarboxylase